MSPRLLILTDPPAPPAFIPRVRFLTDYLKGKGYQLDWETEPLNPYRNKFDWALKAIWSLLTDWRNRHFSREVRRRIAERKYDAVICSTFSTFPLRAALDIAKERDIPLLVDIRDVDEQVPDAQYQAHRQWWAKPFRTWYRAVNIRRRNRVLKEATAITTISPWHVEFLKQFNPAVHLIYNGYDPAIYKPEEVRSDKFYIRYIGKLYEFQEPAAELISEAVSRLHQPDIVLDYIHSGLNNQQVADTINASSIMLVFTSKQTHGMMTTKFYEALGCEKPVLCVPDDEGVLADAIRLTNAGVALDTVEDIQAFIMQQYTVWQTQGFTRQAIHNKQSFSRLTQAKKFEDLLRHSTGI